MRAGLEFQIQDMAWTFLFINLLAILLAAKLRYAGVELANASPVAMADWLWWTAIAASAAAAAAAAALMGRKMFVTSRRPLAELLVFPAMFVFEWGMLPPEHWRAVDWIVIAGFAVVVAAMFLADRKNFQQWGVTGKNFIPAAGRLAIPTLIMAAAPIIAACFIGSDFTPQRLAATLLYPVYALVQLLVFQVFLVTRLRRVTESRATIILISAGMFSLMHWPNGVLMAACFVAAVVWTWVYLDRPNVYTLAIAMGIAAMAFSNALPRDVTQNMRTGPRYVQVASRPA